MSNKAVAICHPVRVGGISLDGLGLSQTGLARHAGGNLRGEKAALRRVNRLTNGRVMIAPNALDDEVGPANWPRCGCSHLVKRVGCQELVGLGVENSNQSGLTRYELGMVRRSWISWQGDGYPIEWASLANRMPVDALRTPFYMADEPGHAESHIAGGSEDMVFHLAKTSYVTPADSGLHQVAPIPKYLDPGKFTSRTP